MSERYAETLRRLLAGRRRDWQRGQAAVAVLRLAGRTALALVVLAALDFFLRFETPALVTLLAVAGAALLAGLAWDLVRLLRSRDRAMAARADALAGNPRHSVQGAYELLEQDAAGAAEPAALRDYLVELGAARAAAQVAALPRRRAAAPEGLQRKALIAAGQLAVALAVFVPRLEAPRVILSRWLFPWRDIPPYSALRFEVEPADAEVVYGGNLDVRARVTGAAVEAPVELVTRHAGRRNAAACFQEGGQRYAQRLERVVAPLDFCFRSGRARSAWHRVNVRLQPQISVALVRLLPPAYSGLPAREFAAGMDEIAGLRGSRVELKVTSNRPLSGGTLALHADSRPGEPVSHSALRTGLHTVQFEWSLEDSARLEVQVRDVQGTASADPLVLAQRLVPDRPPTAVLDTPGGYSFATPAAALPVAGRAEDDLGLRRADLVRSIVGYRDRMRPFGATQSVARLDFAESLDLAALGVAPGDVLEFYVEARDSNPALTGIGASGIARVQVISEEDYAEMIRAQTSAAEFVRRFEVAAREWERYQQALSETAAALQNEALGAEEREELHRKLGAALQKALETFGQLAGDFPAFDLEQELQEDLDKTVDLLMAMREALAVTPPGSAEFPELVDDMLASAEEAGESIEEQQRRADEIGRVAKLMEGADRFRAVVQRQEELVRKLNRFERETRSADRGMLAVHGRTQDSIREELEGFATDLRAALADLPEGYDELRQSATEFLAALESLEVPPAMRTATEAATNQDGERTQRYAALALERLKQLQEQCKGKGFGGLCRGEMAFTVSDVLRATLQQMLARGRSAGNNTGQGPAGGGEGEGSDGYSVQGARSLLNTAVYGPSRMRFNSGSGGGRGDTAAGGDGGRPVPVHVSEERHGGPAERDVRSESVPAEKVPVPYREAVKRYFSEE